MFIIDIIINIFFKLVKFIEIIGIIIINNINFVSIKFIIIIMIIEGIFKTKFILNKFVHLFIFPIIIIHQLNGNIPIFIHNIINIVIFIIFILFIIRMFSIIIINIILDDKIELIIKNVIINSFISFLKFIIIIFVKNINSDITIIDTQLLHDIIIMIITGFIIFIIIMV